MILGRKTTITLLLFVCVSLSSCTILDNLVEEYEEEYDAPYEVGYGDGMPKAAVGPHDNEKMADARMEMLVAAIKTRDKDAITAMFSKQSLETATDFDEGLEYLFDLVQGEVVSLEFDKYTNEDLSEYRTPIYRYNIVWYDLITDVDEYAFFFIDCLVEREEPDKVGLNALRAVRAADRDDYFTSYQDMYYHGIYLPGGS